MKRVSANKNNNKRKHEVAVPFPTLLVGVLILLVIVGAGYMSINIRCDGLGKAIKTQEATLLKARKRLRIENTKWSKKISPMNLERAIERHGLAMMMPKSSQIIEVERWQNPLQVAKLEQRDRS
jgi:hypothetical protein